MRRLISVMAFILMFQMVIISCGQNKSDSNDKGSEQKTAPAGEPPAKHQPATEPPQTQQPQQPQPQQPAPGTNSQDPWNLGPNPNNTTDYLQSAKDKLQKAKDYFQKGSEVEVSLGCLYLGMARLSVSLERKKLNDLTIGQDLVVEIESLNKQYCPK